MTEPLAPSPGSDGRACLPEILFVADLCGVLGGISPSAARRAVLRGECGAYVRICRRIAVRRESLIEALKAREVAVEVAAARPKGGDFARYEELLRGERCAPASSRRRTRGAAPA